jgi:transposase-like protein
MIPIYPKLPSVENPPFRVLLDKRGSSVYHCSPLRVECLPCGSRHHHARTFTKARWICSFFGHSYTVLRQQIGKRIQRTTNDFLQMQHGSLYPALHRLEGRGWVTSEWSRNRSGNRWQKLWHA